MHLMINWEDFLQHHWQKHPVLLKKRFLKVYFFQKG